MAAVEAVFEESLCQALILPTGFGKSLIFQLLPFVFDSWLAASESFILVVSPLNALMRDQTVKLNDLQVRSRNQSIE